MLVIGELINESNHSICAFPDLFHAADAERCVARIVIAFPLTGNKCGASRVRDGKAGR